jgi:O-methyltransferase involved in polyketide biosynthesis
MLISNMTSKRSIQLGRVQESLLVPLYARAIDSTKKRPILRDTKAREIVESLDWDFKRFNQSRRIVGCTLRTALFDGCARDFLDRCPDGTVVEIGAGLNTRFERLDNGKVHWFDLDLPDVVDLRRNFFADTDRRKTLAASVVDPGWISRVRQSPGPYFIIAEAVLVYLSQREVKTALAQIASGFPGLTMVFDSAIQAVIDRENRDHDRLQLGAHFAWACNDPREIERWNIGLRLVESRPLTDMPDALKSRLSLSVRASVSVLPRLFPKFAQAYRVNLFERESESSPRQSEVGG